MTPLRAVFRDFSGVATVLLCGLAGYFLFPDNLALLTRMISVALLVLSLDLVVGYCGVASLGHAALYGMGAYAAGIACLKGVSDPFALVLVGAAAGGVAGVVMGAIMLRTHGLPQLVLSIAIVQLVHEGVNKASAITGGSDGLAGMSPAPLLGRFPFDLWGRSAYLFALFLLVFVLALLVVVARSPFAMLCRGARQDAVRVESLGVPVFPILLRMFAISGAVAGVGGALGAIATQVVGLDSVSFELSANSLVMLALGGVGNLYGALVGSVLFMLVEHVVSSINPFHWMTMIGALMVGVVLAAPGGITGDAAAVWARLLARRDGGGR
jgi:branched-chain amino acid transport system permease protein